MTPRRERPPRTGRVRRITTRRRGTTGGGAAPLPVRPARPVGRTGRQRTRAPGPGRASQPPRLRQSFPGRLRRCIVPPARPIRNRKTRSREIFTGLRPVKISLLRVSAPPVGPFSGTATAASGRRCGIATSGFLKAANRRSRRKSIADRTTGGRGHRTTVSRPPRFVTARSGTQPRRRNLSRASSALFSPTTTSRTPARVLFMCCPTPCPPSSPKAGRTRGRLYPQAPPVCRTQQGVARRPRYGRRARTTRRTPTVRLQNAERLRLPQRPLGPPHRPHIANGNRSRRKIARTQGLRQRGRERRRPKYGTHRRPCHP